jgi:hypothetical protein
METFQRVINSRLSSYPFLLPAPCILRDYSDYNSLTNIRVSLQCYAKAYRIYDGDDEVMRRLLRQATECAFDATCAGHRCSSHAHDVLRQLKYAPRGEPYVEYMNQSSDFTGLEQWFHNTQWHLDAAA